MKLRESGEPTLRRALKNASAFLELHSARHATFEQLSAEGYDIKTFEDGASPLKPEKLIMRNMPENWNQPLPPVIVPKVAVLRDVLLYNDGTALLPDNFYCFHDIAFNHQNVRGLSLHPDVIMRFLDRETNDALIRRNLFEFKVPGRCCSTRRNCGVNFGHFVHDVLSLIYYEDLGAIVPRRDKVIAPRILAPMQKALFKKVFKGYEIVQAPPRSTLRVEELLLPANLVSRNRFNPAAIFALAQRMRRIMEPYSVRESRKVCVSRRDGTPREMRDYANSDTFEANLRKRGYEVIEVSLLDPETQFSLWANVKEIVGIHGAGMMNMIMMPAGGKIIEIAAPTPHPRNTIAYCATAAGHSVVMLGGTQDEQRRTVIDLDELVAILNDASA